MNKMTKTTECIAPIVHLLVRSTKLAPTTALTSQSIQCCKINTLKINAVNNFNKKHTTKRQQSFISLIKKMISLIK